MEGYGLLSSCAALSVCSGAGVQGTVCACVQGMGVLGSVQEEALVSNLPIDRN